MFSPNPSFFHKSEVRGLQVSEVGCICDNQRVWFSKAELRMLCVDYQQVFIDTIYSTMCVQTSVFWDVIVLIAKVFLRFSVE